MKSALPMTIPAIQRPLQIRRAEGVVHDDPDVGIEFMGGLGDQLNVQQLQRGVAGGLEIDHLGLVGQVLLQILNVGQIRQGDLHAELGHAVVQQRVCTAIQRLISHDLVPGHNRGPQGRGDGAHAGSSGHGSLAAFQGGQLFLNGCQSGVAQAGIDVAVFLPGKAGTALLHRGEGEGGGLIDGGAQGASSVVNVPGVDLTGGEA